MSLMRTLLKSLLAILILNSFCYADTFVQVNPARNAAVTNQTQYPQQVSVSPLTPFDEALKNEMQKYPKDSAFFVDGRTGKIISVKPLSNINNTASKPSSNSASMSANINATPANPSASDTRIRVYQPKPQTQQIREERIELLQETLQ